MRATPQHLDRRTDSPPLQGRGRGWGLSANDLARLHVRARAMRNSPTEPEKRLWRYLSGSQLAGRKFRRQLVVGWFIADFACPSDRLIVEVDGDTHDAGKDRLRDDNLAVQGWRVIRVTNADVMTDMEGVLRFIAENLSHRASPHPNPSPEGEGLQEILC